MAKSESYGIKEVADLELWKIPAYDADSKAGKLGYKYDSNVLKFYKYDPTATTTNKWVEIFTGTTGDMPEYVFDSLKVSSIEVTSEQTSARGGKGNPKLMTWSYGKEASLSITDALLSDKSFHLMFGTKEKFAANGIVTVTGDSFPDASFMIGKARVRDYSTQNDRDMYFIIPKGQANPAATITMEAEGDPSTFEMKVDCLASEWCALTDLAKGPDDGTDNKTVSNVLFTFMKPTN